MNNGNQKLLLILSITLIMSLSFCERTSDVIRDMGRKRFKTSGKKLTVEQLQQWERDLNLSRARVKKLNSQIHELVQESNLQGQLSWKIARAFCIGGRYDMAGSYFKSAVIKKDPDFSRNGEISGNLNNSEKSLPYFRMALKKHNVETNLLFDAGLCFANASKAMGWNEDRWKTAVLLFQRIRRIKPNDLRAPYQLALLYGKTNRSKLRDTDRAISLLREIIQKNEFSIPARFVLGHLLTETGEFNQAIGEYSQIRGKLKEMYKRKIITGNLEKNRQYVMAGNNIERLKLCIKGSPQCDIMRR